MCYIKVHTFRHITAIYNITQVNFKDLHHQYKFRRALSTNRIGTIFTRLRGSDVIGCDYAITCVSVKAQCTPIWYNLLCDCKRFHVVIYVGHA